MAGFGTFLTYLFSFPQEEEKMKWMYFKYFISKCTNYIYIYIYIIHYIDYRNLHGGIDYRNLHGGFFVTEYSTR